RARPSSSALIGPFLARQRSSSSSVDSVTLHRARPVYANVANLPSRVALLAASSYTSPLGSVRSRSEACTTKPGVTQVSSSVTGQPFQSGGLRRMQVACDELHRSLGGGLGLSPAAIPCFPQAPCIDVGWSIPGITDRSGRAARCYK